MSDAVVTSHGFTALGPLHEAIARLRGWSAHGIAVLLGAFSTLAFAPFHFTPVLIVSFTGLLWMLDGARARRRYGRVAFARGWWFAFGFFLVSMHWTASAFLVDASAHLMLIWMPLLLLPGGMAIIWGATAALAVNFWSSSPSRIFVFVFAFTFAEWVRGHLFGGLPWNLPGTSHVPGGALSQAASIGGVYWLTLLTIFGAVAPAALVDTRDSKGLLSRLAPSLMAVVMVAGGWAWGAQRLSQPTQFSSQSIVLMDAGVPQDVKWNIHPNELLRRYIELLRGAEDVPDDIVIWPEGALTFSYPEIKPLLRNANALDAVSEWIGERYLIAGTTRYEDDPETGQFDWYNSLAVLDRTSNRSGHLALYDKHRLVPIGELPVARILPFGEKLAAYLPNAIQQQALNGFKPGPGPGVPFVNDAFPPFLAMICYEGLYPEISGKARPRPDWIVLISNDGWFGGGIGPAQHYAQNRYRSIETGLPMARVASRGVSAIVDGKGRETLRGAVQAGDPAGWRSSVARGPLPNPMVPTHYQRNGTSYFWLTWALLALLAFLFWRR